MPFNVSLKCLNVEISVIMKKKMVRGESPVLNISLLNAVAIIKRFLSWKAFDIHLEFSKTFNPHGCFRINTL